MSGPTGSVLIDVETLPTTDKTSGDSICQADTTLSNRSESLKPPFKVLDNNGLGIISVSNNSSWCWFCNLFASVNIREVVSFLIWEGIIVAILILGVADWILFFKYVVEPEEPQVRVTCAALWAIGTLAILYARATMRAHCGAAVRTVADHAEIFVIVSLVMMFSTNVAFFLHRPSTEPLRDIGFLFIPKQDDHSVWRPLSDLLTAGVPVTFMLQSLLMTRENRCRVMCSFFRVATICYLLRTFTVSLTSLPGPAPHCRPGSPDYFPPQSWIDIVTRLGPMYGNFNSCGDLIFSGHMAYTTSAVLLYLRVLDRHFSRFSRLRWGLGMLYLIVLGILCISGRKHYSVDIVLGVIVATLAFFHFEYSWIPLCVTYNPTYVQFEQHRNSTFRRYAPVTTSDRDNKKGHTMIEIVDGAIGNEDIDIVDIEFHNQGLWNLTAQSTGSSTSSSVLHEGHHHI